MKRTYLILLSLLIPYCMFSQLNGSYTIGASNTDYLSIGEALNDLETIGVSGPVFFNLKDGTYNESNLSISNIPGVSQTNNITFQSENLNAENVIIDGNDILYIESTAQYITLKHLKFDSYAPWNSSASRNALRVDGNFINISNCIFTGGSAESPDVFYDNNSNRLKYSYIVANGNNISVNNNNFFTNGSAIHRVFSSFYINDLSFTDNIMNGTMTTPIDLNQVNNLTINNNSFQIAIKYKPIHATNLSGETQIKNNIIHSTNADLDNSFSLTLYGASSNTGSITLANNFITTKNGIYIDGNFNTCRVINNSFYAYEDQCLTFPFDSSNLQNYELYNNIFYSSTDDPDLRTHQTFDLNKLNSNNNAFSKEEEVILYSNSVNTIYYNLTDWQVFSNKDSNSIVTGLVYNSDFDLHTPNALALDGIGISISSDLGFDIDNELRNLASPDIGADEFDMDYSNFLDIEIIEITTPSGLSCDDSGINLSIKNNCNTTINSFDIECAFNGNRGNISNHILTINPNDIVNLNLDGNYQIYENTLYDDITFYVSNPNGILDNNYANNVVTVSEILQLGNFDIIVVYNECDGSYELSVPIIADTSILWSTGETNNVITVNNTGVYSVTINDSLNCPITKSITL